MGIWTKLMQQLRGENVGDDELDSSALERQLDDAVGRLTQRLVDARAAVGSMLEGAARLAFQAREEIAAAAECEQAAAAALQAGDEAHAREALRRKRVHSDAADALSHDLEEHKQVAEHLLQELRGMNDQVEQAKRERSMLLVRLRSAKARQAVIDGMPVLGAGAMAGEPLEVFERIDTEISRLEARARAGEEIERTLAGAGNQGQGSSIEPGLEQDLALLRSRMGLAEAGSAVARLPSQSVGSSPDDAGTNTEQQAKR